ncbi:MAG: hypothetical protein ACTS85_00435 [Arsenophonus sp. NC-PG7-MAG3]
MEKNGWNSISLVTALDINKNKNLIESAFVTVRLWLTRKARSTVVQQNNHFNDI